ncbi:MAG TPA: CRISPR-associated endonuclease Cas2 [Chloroflexus aurantiacus]|jgi:CRISPR-associated protein Cas2|uniref:CRISPR-associated endoribonuclease Cas2 3 n=1 Tax=Chloroflexus aurantiacus (strain ATCC 29366 / DSM 635 / J-10-fl) TaxID=324602 RepID=CAS2C_CHLAA|nr:MULTISPECIES: CRISPR-associated endonuclease Cas2 [Chloroflexus]A9WJV5.1 RecName: Full=CRISPR-associated endoribonuclease Cas2 3 [Chloroflexus aurantiacus J-10-fl]ABY36571.1 CRISPR-associated protein Cas2 [Chloroflexus aurantiacus J-10-fl]HBW67985.1 CRISPR-associated endonuclease Cas2 [Chloroflexus aurantiacus]
MKMFTVISYDIVDDQRRTSVMKVLKGYGVRVQYSVFEAILDAREFHDLSNQLRKIIDPGQDSIRCYRLDQVAAQRTVIYGIGLTTTDPTHYMV